MATPQHGINYRICRNELLIVSIPIAIELVPASIYKNQMRITHCLTSLQKKVGPVYIFAVTNNKGDFNETTRETYVGLRKEGKDAMLGQWASPRGIIYRDIILVASGITPEQALKYKKQYAQLAIVVIRRNDPPEFI